MCYLQKKYIPVDKEGRSRYYPVIVFSSIQIYLHTQDFRGVSRYKSQLLKDIEASQLGMSSSLQQYPQP